MGVCPMRDPDSKLQVMFWDLKHIKTLFYGLAYQHHRAPLPANFRLNSGLHVAHSHLKRKRTELKVHKAHGKAHGH